MKSTRKFLRQREQCNDKCVMMFRFKYRIKDAKF